MKLLCIDFQEALQCLGMTKNCSKYCRVESARKQMLCRVPTPTSTCEHGSGHSRIQGAAMLLTQVESLQVGQLHDGFHACPGELTLGCIQASQLAQLADSIEPQAN